MYFHNVKRKAHIQTESESFDIEKETIVTGDASKSTIKAFFDQKCKNRFFSTAFAWRKLNNSEENHTNHKNKLFSLVYGTDYYHDYLYKITFEAISNHESFKYFETQKSYQQERYGG